LTPEEDMIRCVLTLEAHEPLRIVLGYSGFASESELRKGLIRFLKNRITSAGSSTPTPGFGVQSFPNQIICGGTSLLKINGMPFGVPLLNSGYWSFFASRANNPLHILLELLWTRLSYTYGFSSSIFGDDLEMEAVSPLLDAKWRPGGWEYRFTQLTKEQLRSGPDKIGWEPETVSLAEYVVLNKLCQGVAVSLDDPRLVEFLREQSTSPDELATALNEKHLAHLKGREVALLTDGCACVTLPDGRYVVGENKTGKLSRWVDQFMEKRKGEPAEKKSPLPDNT
jgi:hypothetical protein